MPPKAPLTSIECYTLSHLHDELASIQDALSVTETEETWDSIANALSRFAALCNGNANNYPDDLVATFRSLARPITSAINSERTRLSGTATDLVTTAVTALGSAFEPLIPHYLPTLFTLCTRTNKVFLNRAKACIAALVEYTQGPMIIHYAAEAIKDKSVSLRLAAAETLMLCMKSYNPPDLEKESRAKEIEAVIRSTAVDASADVRKVSKKIFEAYKILLPKRLRSFTEPLTPRTRKYLDIKATTVVPAASSQPPSRPTSSQSTRSTQSESRAITSSKPSSSTAAAQRPSKHVRSVSTSHTTAEAAPPRRPLRAPTPEVAPVTSSTSHDNGPRRPVREEPRRLKVNMPPPDYIPAHTGPQRPMSATELHFPTHAPSDRPVSGPQRVLRPELVQAGSSTNAARTGPIRPFMFMPTTSEDGTGAEKKERVIGGARRVLRVPEPEPAPPAVEKGKAPAAGSKPPIRPRVISTSRSTPAVPLQAAAVVKDEAARVKKLASSMGASSRGTAAGAPAPRLGRTASASMGQGTASSRARTADKLQEKDERRVRTQSREEREKEKVQVKDREKEKERERRPSSRTAAAAAAPGAASRHGPAPTVTMRDKTNRMHAKASSKHSTKEVQKASSKTRSSPDVPEVVETVDVVSPAEVPLPDTPKVSPVVVREPSPPPLICLDTTESSLLAPVLAPTLLPTAPEQVAAPVPIPVFRPLSPKQETVLPPAPAFKPLSPSDVPLPSSRPSSAEGTQAPPHSESGLAPPAPAFDINEPHTPTPAHRPQRRGAEVEQTPISALVASIQRGFLAMHSGAGLETMAEMDEEESVLVGDAGEDGTEMFPPVSAPAVEPLFSRPSVHA
ncbi:hypothetical protein L226DRAFT_610474 [Lentinus tigrinus ALCF2SS1-7]|uniref:uncharacterized protein n=1 Tax=Lentinus tigrinus ALCF2SS1-7 TaxID=1328758 RepID=UPI00116607F1|nr:hypothetical protein L226DRAFT_610474 [Lentinus tigrinus ALCF2SS1-7]